MFRIAFLVTRSDTIGGSHIHVRDLGLALMEDGHEVAVIIGGDGPIADQFKKLGLNVTSIPDLERNITLIKDVKAYHEIKEAIQNFHPDLVSTHSSKAGFLGRMTASKLNIPVLFTAHGWSFTTGKNSLYQYLYRILEKFIAPYSDKIITVSEYDKKLAIDKLRLSNEDVITIYNGMNDVEQSLMANLDQKTPVNIIKIARFDHQKDHAELLDAIHDISNIHVHFVGDGPLMNRVKSQAGKLGMTNRITFWGRLESVNEVLAQSQIFTLISNWEGFPRSTLEAMRAGLPTVVSDVGGAAEAVVDGKTGYVVAKGDIKKLHDVLEELVSEPEKRKNMGRAARERYEKNYTFGTMYKKTLSVYSEILSDKLNQEVEVS